MSTAAVTVHNVSVGYGRVQALRAVNLTIGRGQVVGLIGMNGSGKSTLFKTMMGQLIPDTGSVTILGGSAATARKNAAIGYVPQSEQVDWQFPISVREVVTAGRYGQMGFTRRARASDRAAVAAALDEVELTDLAGRQIGALSGGQRKRAFVARGIAQGAELMLLDEPFAGVDKRSEATITRQLRALADGGTTVIISTHDLHALPDLADEAILLNQTVLLHDSPAEVLRPENLARAFGLDVLQPTGTEL